MTTLELRQIVYSRKFRTVTTIQDLVATGEEKWKDQTHGWIYKFYPERNDNLICAAVQKKDAIIIKAIMHHWEEAPE